MNQGLIIFIVLFIFVMVSVFAYVYFSCKQTGKSCQDDSECCNGLSCSTDGKCVPQCTVSGGKCSKPGDCCSGPCTSGVCCTTGSCTQDSDCCDSMICDGSGSCVQKTSCSKGKCDTLADCCQGFMYCTAGTCSNTPSYTQIDGYNISGQGVLFPDGSDHVDNSDSSNCASYCNSTDTCDSFIIVPSAKNACLMKSSKNPQYKKVTQNGTSIYVKSGRPVPR